MKTESLDFKFSLRPLIDPNQLLPIIQEYVKQCGGTPQDVEFRSYRDVTNDVTQWAIATKPNK
jgi:hypothetical protein